MLVIIDSLPYEIAIAAWFASASLIVCVWLAAAASIAWAPAGALFCALIARGRGLSPRRCAIMGAVCSALFFLPWVYLVIRMSGRRVPKIVVVLAYAVIYASWLQGAAQFSYFLWRSDGSYIRLGTWLFNIAMIIASLALIMYIRGKGRGDSPHPARLAPFVGLLCSASVEFALSRTGLF